MFQRIFGEDIESNKCAGNVLKLVGIVGTCTCGTCTSVIVTKESPGGTSTGLPQGARARAREEPHILNSNLTRTRKGTSNLNSPADRLSRCTVTPKLELEGAWYPFGSCLIRRSSPSYNYRRRTRTRTRRPGPSAAAVLYSHTVS